MFSLLRLTCEYWWIFPTGKWSGTAVLSNGQLQQEDGNAQEGQSDAVWDEKGSWYKGKANEKTKEHKFIYSSYFNIDMSKFRILRFIDYPMHFTPSSVLSNTPSPFTS